MELREIEGRIVKIGDTSVTVKNEQNKTVGVVTNIRKFKDMPANVQSNFFSLVRKAGIWGSGIDGIMDCVVSDGKGLCYINDTRPLRAYEAYFANGDWPDETKRYQHRLEIAKKAAEYMTVLNCEVRK